MENITEIMQKYQKKLVNTLIAGMVGGVLGLSITLASTFHYLDKSTAFYNRNKTFFDEERQLNSAIHSIDSGIKFQGDFLSMKLNTNLSKYMPYENLINLNYDEYRLLNIRKNMQSRLDKIADSNEKKAEKSLINERNTATLVGWGIGLSSMIGATGYICYLKNRRQDEIKRQTPL